MGSAPEVGLRALAVTDAHALTALYRDNRDFLAELEPLRPESFFSYEGQRRHITQLTERRAAGTAYPYLILLRGTPVGAINLSNVARGAFQSANVGYWVAEEHNGKGIATLALALLCRRAFGELALHRLEAGTLLDNRASQRVIEKNGFTRIGIAPNYLQIAGRWSDHVLFQRTVEDPDPGLLPEP